MSHECFGCICRQSIKHYFLLDQGDFLVYFMDSSSAAHCASSDRKSRLSLRRRGASLIGLRFDFSVRHCQLRRTSSIGRHCR
jgi:hypothetical protein